MFKERAPIFIDLAWRSPASPTASSGTDAETLRSVFNRKVTIRTYFPRTSRPRDSRITRSYVIANLRGGGELEETWHGQGALTHEQNVFDEFIAAAEYLLPTTTPLEFLL
jgi:Prolyl oligopeptidase family